MDITKFRPPKDDVQYASLMQAVIENDMPRLEAVLKTGPNLCAVYGPEDEDGAHGVLHEAAARGHVEIIQTLLDHGAPVDVLDDTFDGSQTPLHYAALLSHVEACRVLLDAGADVNADAYDNGIPLNAVLCSQRPTEKKHVNTLNLLLDRGSNINTWCQNRAAVVRPKSVIHCRWL